ncbi:MAG: hypothetical protein Q8J76_03650, partial [Desulfobulbaceae bacterium]|nr:hypothetical protein [Desulfobulbaceae bacterium]
AMRLFDPISQRSIQEITEAEIIPASDILYPATDAGQTKLLTRIRQISEDLRWSRDELDVILEKIDGGLKFPGIEFFIPLFYDTLSDPLSFLTPGSMIFLLDPHQIARTIQLVWERINTNYQESQTAQTAIVPPEELFLTEEVFNQRTEQFRLVKLFDFEESPTETTAPLPPETTGSQTALTNPAIDTISLHCGNHILIKQHLELQRQKFGLLAPLTAYLRDWLNTGDQIHISCRSERHATQLGQMLSAHDLPITISNGPALTLTTTSKAITLYPFPLSAGFDLLEEKIHFVSEIELFGEKRISRTKKRKAKTDNETTVNFEELKIGDIVVHRDHGLAIYDGIINIIVGEVANDFLLLTYK